jgi:hypothetical protein
MMMYKILYVNARRHMHSNEARRSIRTKANNLGRCRTSMYISAIYILPLRGQRWIRT